MTVFVDSARHAHRKGVRIFLDELPADHDDGVIEDISCGPECAPPADTAQGGAQ